MHFGWWHARYSQSWRNGFSWDWFSDVLHFPYWEPAQKMRMGSALISANAQPTLMDSLCAFCSMKRKTVSKIGETWNNTRWNNNSIFRFTSVSNLIFCLSSFSSPANLWETQKSVLLFWIRNTWFGTFLVISKPCSHESNTEVRK